MAKIAKRNKIVSTERGDVKIEVGPWFVWITWPDGQRERMTPHDAKTLFDMDTVWAKH